MFQKRVTHYSDAYEKVVSRFSFFTKFCFYKRKNPKQILKTLVELRCVLRQKFDQKTREKESARYECEEEVKEEEEEKEEGNGRLYLSFSSVCDHNTRSVSPQEDFDTARRSLKKITTFGERFEHGKKEGVYTQFTHARR